MKEAETSGEPNTAETNQEWQDKEGKTRNKTWKITASKTEQEVTDQRNA